MAGRSSGNDFDFDKHDPGPGGFFAELFPTGNVMIAWGRRGRSKWVKLDQAEVTNFLTHAHKMIVTDSAAVKELLGQLAATLAGEQPLTFERLAEIAAADPEIGVRFAEIATHEAPGDLPRALELMRDELAKAGKL